jgi:O-antigen/teichoic acid export membrane protein
MLKRDVLINYISQLYMAALNVLVVPIYLKLLGAEAYGLIGVFIMAQGLMQILDIGLSATLSREATKYIVSPETAPTFRYIFDKVSKFFLIISLLLVVVLLPLANKYALDWFNYSSLNPNDVSISISLIIIIVALRFLITPMKSILLGLEKHVWLNIVVIIMGSLKYLGVIPLIIFYSKAPTVFFIYELCIAVIEAAVISFYTFRLLPKKDLVRAKQLAKTETTSKVIKFSLAHGFVAMIWLVLTQVDRVVLSKVLPLDQFGYFSAVATAASGIMLLSSPLSRALLPRMTALLTQKDLEGLIQIYRKSTRLLSMSVVPIGILIMGFSAELLWLWTGNAELAVYGKNVLFWYALGNTVLVVAAFPYYLQFAYGELKFHVWGNIVSLTIGLPLIVVLTLEHGAVGAGISWASLQITSFFIFTYLVHKRFLANVHWRWLLMDVMPGFIISGTLVFVIRSLNMVVVEMNRSEVFLRLGLISIFVLSVCFFLNKLFSRIKLYSK